MGYFFFGWVIGAILFHRTPKEGRKALVTLVAGAVCGGILAAIALPMIGVELSDPWTLLGGWIFCSLILHVMIRYMNTGVEMNLLIFFGLGLFSPILAFLAALAFLVCAAISGKAKI